MLPKTLRGAQKLFSAIAIAAMAVILSFAGSCAKTARASFDDPDNTMHMTVIHSDRILTEMPTNFGQEFTFAYGHVTALYCEGSTYTQDGSEGHLWFDLTIDPNGFIGNTTPLFIPHAFMCIDRALAAPGGASGGSQGWPIAWTGEKTYGELKARLVSTDA